jgi:GTPase SAR1 family protein
MIPITHSGELIGVPSNFRRPFRGQYERKLEAQVVFLGESAVENHLTMTTPKIISLHHIEVDSNQIKLKVENTAGQEHFRVLTPMDFRDLHIAVHDDASFKKVSEWIETIRKDTIVIPQLFVVGNKINLERAVTSQEGDVFAEKVAAVFVECSPKTGQRISELFVLIAEKALRLRGAISETQQLLDVNPEGSKQKGGC